MKLELGLDQAWHADAWEAWRKVPEVKQLMLFLGNQLAKLRIFPAIDNPDDPEGDPLPITADASPVPERIQLAVMAELARLMTHDGGISELLRRLDLNLEIPGEGYLVGYGARDAGQPDPRSMVPDAKLTAPLPEKWEIVSKSTILVEGQGEATRTAIRQHPGDQKGRRLDKDIDCIIRIYQADPEWPALADSAMQGVLFDCRILMALSAQVLAVVNSQMMAGILTVPNELSFGPAVPAENDDGTAAPSEDPLDQELDDVFTEVVEIPDSLMTIRPTLLRGPGQYLSDQFVRFIEMGRKLDSQLDSQIEARVRRVARGLNAPVEAVEGHDATTFANAKQIDRDLFDDHVEPRATGMVNGLTSGFLTPNLRDTASKEDDQGTVTITDQELWDWADEIFLWYDPSSIIREPDTEAGADAAHERGTISDSSYRRAKGFSEDDAPDPLELLIRSALRRGTLDPVITLALLEEIAAQAGVTLPDMSDVTSQGAPGAAPDQMRVLGAALLLRERIRTTAGETPGDGPLMLPPAVTASGSFEFAGPNPGARLLAIDSELTTRLLAATNDAMERALERTGNRLRSRVASAHRPLLDGLPPRMFAQALGRGLVADAGVDLTDDWSTLAGQFDAWVAAAQTQALDELDSIVGGLPNRDDLAARQDDDRAAAWAWLAAALGLVLTQRLFDPSPDAPPVGEHDGTSTVPSGVVRTAITRAGGAEVGPASADATGVLADAGTRPVAGVASGELVQGQLRDHGAEVTAYRWVYGHAMRSTFLPHAQLDGTVYTSYDDPRLVNGSGFPPFGFYFPQDHHGCRCAAELVIVPPDALAALIPFA